MKVPRANAFFVHLSLHQNEEKGLIKNKAKTCFAKQAVQSNYSLVEIYKWHVALSATINTI